jgi:hypothetical protein
MDSLTLPPVSGSLGVAAPVTAATASSTDPPSEVYAKVARGALKCWFGPSGALKATHAFHARVDPPASGGSAEIVVHTRDPAQPAYGAVRAYHIAISPSGSGSTVEAQNLRFPDVQGGAMTADVTGWINGKEGCTARATEGVAAPQPIPVAQAVPATKKKSAVKKSAGKRAAEKTTSETTTSETKREPSARVSPALATPR